MQIISYDNGMKISYNVCTTKSFISLSAQLYKHTYIYRGMINVCVYLCINRTFKSFVNFCLEFQVSSADPALAKYGNSWTIASSIGLLYTHTHVYDPCMYVLYIT